MRTTNLAIQDEEALIQLIKQNVKKRLTDITITQDSVRDIYAMFSVSDKMSIMRAFNEMYLEIKSEYTHYQIASLLETVRFYSSLQESLISLSTTPLFKELDKLEPLEATERLLQLMNGGRAGEQVDRHGYSADPENIPIDNKRLEMFNSYTKAGLFGNSPLSLTVKEAAEKVEELTKEYDKRIKELLIYKIAKLHESQESYKISEKVLDSVTPEDSVDVRHGRDLVNILPSEFMYPSIVRAKRYNDRTLLNRVYQKTISKRQSLYILLDGSGTMHRDRHGVVASGIALSLVRQLYKQGGAGFFRLFDSEPKELMSIGTRDEVIRLSEYLMKIPYTGGGTDIKKAINVAVDEISGYEKAEILLITDGEDVVKNVDLKGVILHTLCLGVENSDLKKTSKTYVSVMGDWKDYIDV